jgi:anionic cell wall polymer biosynthesis LytR-Cps2A-Psr (LCP) family protein
VKGFLVNDANPRRPQAEGGPDDERDPYAQDPYYQQQSYGYDPYAQPQQTQGQPQQQAAQQAPPHVPQQPQPGYQDPYYGDPGQTYAGQTYAGQQQGWIPQQPQSPYYEQGYGTGQQPRYDTGRQPGYDTGQQPVYDTGQQPGYGTGPQPGYDTGQQPGYGTGQHAVYDTGQHAVYDTGQQAAYDTGQQSLYDTGQHAVHETGRQPVHDTGQQPVYDTGQHTVYGTGRHTVHDTGQQQAFRAEPGAAGAAGVGATGAGAVKAPGGQYETEQFAFIDEESEESEEVIDWLKFSESRTERREEAKRRGKNRKVGLILLVVLAMLGGAGYLWQAGKLPGVGDSKKSTAGGGGAQKRDVIVVHLIPVDKGPSATALLVDNETKGRGTTVLLPNSLSVTTEDGTATTLDKAVGDGVGPTRDALNSLLGSDIKGTWRLDTPYLELLVDSLGDIFVDTDTAVKGTGKDKDKTLVQQGKQTELTGQAAVAYATYLAPGEPQTKQLSRFGQVMQAVLKKMPSDALSATKTVQALAQILDPSLTDKQLGASLAQLAELAKTGSYDTAMLPVQKDGTLSAKTSDSVVKDILGGTVKESNASAQARVLIKDATGNKKNGPMAQAAIVNGGTYTYVPGGTADTAQATSQIVYSDPARLAAAKDVASTLGLPASAVKKGTVPATADIAVTLGKDYKPATGQ